MTRTVLIALMLASSSAAAQSINLMRAGQQSKSAVTSRTGWLALWPTSLAAAKLSFDPARDPIADEGKPESVRSALDVRVVGQEELPLVFVKGLPARAVTPLLPEGESVFIGDSLKPVTLGELTFTTQTYGDRGRRLLLTRGATSQVLFEAPEADTDGWSVRWAGDLDGDGKVDLLITADRHYNLETLRLLLSSRAKKNELVHQVAFLSVSGC